MQIFVDADACPVAGIVETIAEKYNISTTLLCDTNHILYSDYSEVIVVGAGADAVDYKLISICHKGDVVVSQATQFYYTPAHPRKDSPPYSFFHNMLHHPTKQQLHL